MKETKKINKGIITVIILLILVILSLISYIIYEKIKSDRTLQNSNNITTSSTTTTESNKLSDKEIEEYLSYVPIKPETDLISNYNEYYDYDEDAYSGKIENINNINEKLLLAYAYNNAKETNTEEEITSNMCGDSVKCRADKYVLETDLISEIKKMYNINTINSKSFKISGGIVEQNEKYYLAFMNLGASPINKINKILNYEFNNEDLVIYEKAGFIVDLQGEISILKTTNKDDITKEDPYTNKDDATKYIEENINEFNTYKHTFKLNENNNYYWYSTELSN